MLARGQTGMEFRHWPAVGRHGRGAFIARIQVAHRQRGAIIEAAHAIGAIQPVLGQSVVHVDVASRAVACAQAAGEAQFGVNRPEFATEIMD